MYDFVEIVQTETAGRGLRASRDIAAGTVLFVAPTIRVPQQQYEDHCRHTVFEDYLFVGSSGDSHLALALGSVFNHSSSPNVLWRLDEATNEITYSAFLAVAAGTDLCISYGAWGRQYEDQQDDQTGHGDNTADFDSDSSGGENDILYYGK